MEREKEEEEKREFTNASNGMHHTGRQGAIEFSLGTNIYETVAREMTNYTFTWKRNIYTNSMTIVYKSL